jgi:hypothetical protein
MKSNRQLPSLVLLKEPNPMEKFFTPPDENLKKALAAFNRSITLPKDAKVTLVPDEKMLRDNRRKPLYNLQPLPHENRHK